jgi:dGTPase
LAAVLKRDSEIPVEVADKSSSLKPKKVKGYYASERPLVLKLKENILGKDNTGLNLRTIECSIMDVADDITYTTYDLEDSFHGGFMTLMDMLSCSNELAEQVADMINGDDEASAIHPMAPEQVQQVLRDFVVIGNEVLTGMLRSADCVSFC